MKRGRINPDCLSSDFPVAHWVQTTGPDRAPRFVGPRVLPGPSESPTLMCETASQQRSSTMNECEKIDNVLLKLEYELLGFQPL